MLNTIKKIPVIATAFLLLTVAGCKKGTFDINDVNPNSPSDVSADLLLTGSLVSSATVLTGGNQDFANYWMGYWAVSGDYIPNNTVVLYQLTTDYFSGNWDASYITLKNFRQLEEKASADANLGYYTVIAKTMKSLMAQRLVDLYNNIPYSEALQGIKNTTPKFDKAEDVYAALIVQLDSAVALKNIADGNVNSVNPDKADAMFGGDMDKWVRFANTIKLKILMRLTEMSGSSATISAGLSGLETSDFLQAGENAVINPGYSNASNDQQNPLWQDVGFNTSGTAYVNNQYYRACSFAVNFYKSTNDPRAEYFFALNNSGAIQGRQFGSTALEHNSDISGVGPGILKDPGQDAIILPAFESLFLQAEAVQRGYLAGATADDLYQAAVEESFKLLGVPDAVNAADDYISQSGDNVNYTSSANKLKTLITQKWAALNAIDPIEAWSDWRRLNYPAGLPVSVYPGVSTTHPPYRLLYPSSEYNYNPANVNTQGTIDPISSKIFWMP